MKRIVFACLVALCVLLPLASAGHRHAKEALSPALYGADNQALYFVNAANGHLKKIADFHPKPFLPQLSYDRNHRFLYGFSQWLGFYAIDKDTAEMFATGLGSQSFTNEWTDPFGNPFFPMFAFAYNPWNNHIYTVGQEIARSTATHFAEIDPWGWKLVAAQARVENMEGTYFCGTFDPWTGYMLFGRRGLPGDRFPVNALSAFDPGTGHVPGSLETYPIPDLNHYIVFSLTVSSVNADIYFVGKFIRTVLDPFGEPTALYRVQRGTGQVFYINETSVGSIAFGDVVSP